MLRSDHRCWWSSTSPSITCQKPCQWWKRWTQRYTTLGSSFASFWIFTFVGNLIFMIRLKFTIGSSWSILRDLGSPRRVTIFLMLDLIFNIRYGFFQLWLKYFNQLRPWSKLFNYCRTCLRLGSNFYWHVVTFFFL